MHFNSLELQTDITTAVSYFFFQGGTRSPISLSTGDGDLEVVFTENNAFSALRIPGEDNLVADFLSRGKFLLSE